MSRRAMRVALVVLACLASAGAIALALAGLSFAAAGAYALAPLAVLAYGRVRGRSPQTHGPRSDAPKGSGAAAVSPKDMTPHERAYARMWGFMGLEGQLHWVGLLWPPMFTFVAVALLALGGNDLAAAFALAVGAYLTRLGWLAGLRFDPVAPKVPSLDTLEAGRPWIDIIVLVVVASALFWLARDSLAVDAVTEGAIIAALGTLSAAGLVLPARAVWRRRRRRNGRT